MRRGEQKKIEETTREIKGGREKNRIRKIKRYSKKREERPSHQENN